MTRREIRKELKKFVDEVKNCRSVEEARDIERRLEDCYSNNEVLDEDDALLQSGYGEALYMMAAHNCPI